MSTFQALLIQSSFYVNSHYIIKELCVNRFKPAMHCDGKCYLKKQLKATEKNKKENSNRAENNTTINLFITTKSNLIKLDQYRVSVNYFDTYRLLNPDWTSIFHPPQA